MSHRSIYPWANWITRPLVLIWWVLCALLVAVMLRQLYAAMPWDEQAIFGVSFYEWRKPLFASLYAVGVFSITIALGSMFWVVITRLIHAKWGKNISFVWESISWSCLGLWMIALCAMFCGPATIFDWFQYYVLPHQSPDPIFSTESGFWWNPDAFYLRQACFFFIIGILVTTWRHKSIASWKSDLGFMNTKSIWLTTILLILIALTSLGSIDWVGGLQADDVPSLVPFYGIIYSLVCGLALGVIGLFHPLKMNPFIVIPWGKVGGVLLSMVLIKTYLLYGQYVITWFSNLPETTEFYVDRLVGDWGWIAGLGAIAEMLIPIILLLIPAVRRSKWGNMTASAFILIGSFLELLWLICPIVGVDVDNMCLWAAVVFSVLLGMLIFIPAICFQLNQASLFTHVRKK